MDAPCFGPLAVVAFIPCVPLALGVDGGSERPSSVVAVAAVRATVEPEAAPGHGKGRAEPSRFVVHIRYFGGFDMFTLRPAAVLEDRVTGELSAVHPASWRVPEVCKRFGVEMIRG